LLRIRERMRAMLLDHSDAFLDKGELKRAAGGYRAAAGLEYDYSAYPEPLPSVPDYAKRALVLHADYPQRPEDCVSLGETPRFVQSALSYLLLSGELAERLADRPLETKVALAVELVRRIDPDWDAFAERYRKAAAMTAAVADRFRAASERGRRAESLSEIIAEEFGDDPSAIPAALLGRSIENGQWWQYVKELAVTHPAGALFVARQDVNDHEIIVPRRRGDDPLSKALGLARTGDESAEATDAIGTDRL
jgi:hypothetical protein